MMHPMIAARAFNTPLLLDEGKAAAFMQGFGQRLLGDHTFETTVKADGLPETYQPRASVLDDDLADSISIGGAHGYVIKNGVAIIQITGVLIHRGAWIGNSSGQTSYEGIRAQIDAAYKDNQVRAIALEIDSSGGEVAGCFDLADRIREVGRTKPVRAFISEHAYSAAYALASQADKIVVPRTGGVGSIGVICMHAEYTEALKDSGIKVTIFRAGARKAEGNSYEKLPKGFSEETLATLEMMRGLFCATVAEGRGARMSAEAAKATEARCFDDPAEAVADGLADIIAEPRAAFQEFLSEVNEPVGFTRRSATAESTTENQKGNQKMKNQATTDQTTDTTTADDENNEAETDAPVAGGGGGDASEEKQPSRSTTAAEERSRIAAILTSDEAKGRDDLAKHFAFHTDMTPDAANLALSKSPVSGAVGGLSTEMSGKDPDLSDGGSGEQKKSTMTDVHAKRNAKRNAKK